MTTGTEQALKAVDPAARMQIQAQVPQLAEQVAALVVRDAASMTAADGMVGALARMRKFVEGAFAPAKKSAKQALDDIKAAEQAFLAPLVVADQIMRGKMTAYEAHRRAEEARARREEEAAAKKRADEEKLAEAVRLEALSKATGDQHYMKVADQVLDRPSRPVALPPEKPKAENSFFRDEVSVTVDDFGALVQAVAAGKVLPQALKADESWLKRKAESDGVSFDVPGVTRHVNIDITVRPK